MTTTTKLAFTEFEAQLNKFLSASEKGSGLIIDEGLNVIQKSGISWCMRWCVLWLQDTVTYYLGKEIVIFNHARVEKVAQKFLEQCQAHNEHFKILEIEPYRIFNKSVDIFTKLNEKTHQKHEDLIYTQIELLYNLLPTSCQSSRPKSVADAVDSKQVVTTVSLKFPKDLEAIGLDETGKNQIEKAVVGPLKKITPQSTLTKTVQLFTYKVKFSKNAATKEKYLQVLQKSPISSLFTKALSFSIPLTIHFTFSEKNVERILIISKEVIGRGGERAVRRVWNMVRSSWFAIKRCSSKMEEELLKHFSANPKRGLPSNIIWLDSVKHPREKQIIEPHYMEPFPFWLVIQN